MSSPIVVPESKPREKPLPNVAAALRALQGASGVPDRIEVLVHNISHADVMFSLQIPTDGDSGLRSVSHGAMPKRCSACSALKAKVEFAKHQWTKSNSERRCKMCTSSNSVSAATNTPNEEDGVIVRPRFANVRRICCLVDEVLSDHLADVGRIVDRNDADLPIGVCVAEVMPSTDLQWNSFVASQTARWILPGDESRGSPRITGVYVPLATQIVQRWITSMNVDSTTFVKKYLYLISGGGEADTTEFSSKIIGKCINRFFPSVEVVYVNSSDLPVAGDSHQIYRFDSNVAFINTELKPLIAEHRTRLASWYSDGWIKRLGVTVTLCEGTAARVAAIAAGMREFQPSTIHVVQPRSFLDSATCDPNNLEFHTCEVVDAVPAVRKERLTDDVSALTARLLAFRSEFVAVMEGENEIGSFWLRKTLKPVVSVLMVKVEGELKFFCSTNLEVSMPTGSLCAERNAIGTALSSHLTLRRSNILAVAVLSMPPVSKQNGGFGEVTPGTPPSPSHALSRAAAVSPSNEAHAFQSRRPAGKNPLGPCGACMEWLRKIAQVNPNFKIVMYTDTDCTSAYVHTVDSYDTRIL